MTLPNFNYSGSTLTLKRKLAVGLSLGVLLLAVFSAFNWTSGFMVREIEVNGDGNATIWQKVAQIFPRGQESVYRKEYVMPPQEKNRLDILILGVRGDNDAVNGGLLTDTIMLFSVDKSTNKASLVSIPRDFHVYINDQFEDKINSAYERLGLNGVKKLVSKITGVYIDHVVVFNFESFKQVVDVMGGIDVTLERPFEETTQWGYAFSLPVGQNHLDGQSALYYVRSRYSTSDFDRAARQQKVIFALKEKVLQTDFLSDPIKAFSLLNTLRNNIKTDIDVLDIKNLLGLANEVDAAAKSIRRYVLTTENLLYETKVEGVYYLLPRGNTLAPMKTFFKDLPNKLTLPTPTPSPTQTGI